MPEFGAVEVELRAAYAQALGHLAQMVQQILLGRPKISARLPSKRLQQGVGFVVAANHAAHAAADVADESVAGVARRGDAVDGFHALERLYRGQRGAGVLPQNEPALLHVGEACRMGKGQEVPVGDVGREPPARRRENARAGRRGVIAQAAVEQAIEVPIGVVPDLGELPQDRLLRVPEVFDGRGKLGVLGRQIEDNLARRIAPDSRGRRQPLHDGDGPGGRTNVHL